MKCIILIFLFLANSAWTKVNERDLLINEIITKMSLNLNGEIAGVDGQKVSKNVKNDLKNKMKSSYKLDELKQIKATLNDEIFNQVNQKVSQSDIKIEDVLLKSPTEEFAKLSSEKKTIALGLEKKMDFKKYSKATVKLMGDKLVEGYAQNLPSSMVDTLKTEVTEKAEGGLLASLYEKVGTIDNKDLNHYSGLIEKKPFQKYYRDVLDLGLKHLSQPKQNEKK